MNRIKTSYKRNFNFQANLCSLGDWLESHFVGHPEDRFSRDEAQLCTQPAYNIGPLSPTCETAFQWRFIGELTVAGIICLLRYFAYG